MPLLLAALQLFPFTSVARHEPRRNFARTIFLTIPQLVLLLLFYDLMSAQNAPAFSTNAHARALTAISLDHDAHIVATAADDGALRLWKRHSGTLELVFELTNDLTPIQEMHLSPNGDFLYLLRPGERGVRRLDIDRLMRIFETHGL